VAKLVIGKQKSLKKSKQKPNFFSNKGPMNVVNQKEDGKLKKQTTKGFLTKISYLIHK